MFQVYFFKNDKLDHCVKECLLDKSLLSNYSGAASIVLSFNNALNTTPSGGEFIRYENQMKLSVIGNQDYTDNDYYNILKYGPIRLSNIIKHGDTSDLENFFKPLYNKQSYIQIFAIQALFQIYKENKSEWYNIPYLNNLISEKQYTCLKLSKLLLESQPSFQPMNIINKIIFTDADDNNCNPVNPLRLYKLDSQELIDLWWSNYCNIQELSEILQSTPVNLVIGESVDD